MSLSTNVSDLATRVATEAKSIRTLLNGNAADNSALTTTAKSSMLAAVNEIHSLVLSGGNSVPISGGTMTGRLGFQIPDFDVSLTSGDDGAIFTGPVGGQHLAIGDDEIQSKATGTTAGTLNLNILGGAITTGAGLFTVGGSFTLTGASTFTSGTGLATMGGKLRVNSTESPTLASGVGALNVGSITGSHIAVGGINIQAKANATTATNLALNPLGGAVQIGTGGLSITGAGVFAGGTGASSFGGKLLVASTEVPALTSNTGSLNIGAIAGIHVAVGGNDIQAKASATTTTTLDLNPLGGGVIIAQGGGNVLIGNGSSTTSIDGNAGVSSTVAPTLTATPAAFIVGGTAHVAIGGNDVQSKTNATTAGALDLNPLGGQVNIGTLMNVNGNTLSTTAAMVLAAGPGFGVAITGSMLTFNGSDIATDASVAAAISNLVDTAPTTLDTLNELAAALGDDPNFATTMTTALSNRVRVDTAAQGLNGTQQDNARTNIDVWSKAEVGSVTTNYVTVFEAGLV